MDEGAHPLARASNVRVEKKKIASAARGRPAETSGRKAPAAKPDPIKGGSVSGEKCLMQRQPWWPAGKPAHAFGPG
ncbi:MAG TPA: hypothetical protein VFZ91_06250 [Allosphingosinicella sp.]